MFQNMFINLVMFVAVFSVVNFVKIKGKNDENDLRLTLNEKNGLEELRNQVSGEIQEDFMNTDFYLIRWLRKANLNVKSARNMVLQNQAWRDRNNISRILDEDFSDLQQDCYLQLQGHDKKGRPVVEVDLGECDIRAAVIQGKLSRLHRYLLTFTERSIKAIFTAQGQGKPVTRYVALIDVNGFNLRQHGCSGCISFLLQWISEFNQFYPDFVDENIFINVPSSGRVVLNSGKAIMSPDLRSRLTVFDTNRANWMKYLDARVDRDQRSPRYGGTAVRG